MWWEWCFSSHHVITNCLENNEVFHVTSFDKSNEVWDELIRLFEAQDVMTIYNVLVWQTDYIENGGESKHD